MKIQKNGGSGGLGRGGRVGGFRADVNEELKFLGKFTKKKTFGGEGVRRGSGGGSGWWGRVRVDVNAMFGGGGDVRYGGCEPRIEGIVQYSMFKKVLYNIKKMKKMWGEGQYLNPKHFLCI